MTIRAALDRFIASGDVVGSLGRDLRAQLTLAQQAEAAGDPAGVRVQLRQFTAALYTAFKSKLSEPALTSLTTLLVPWVSGQPEVFSLMQEVDRQTRSGGIAEGTAASYQQLVIVAWNAENAAKAPSSATTKAEAKK